VEARYPSDASALEFEETLDAQGIRYESRASGGSGWWSILVYLLPFLLFMGFWVFVMRRAQEKDRDRRRGEWQAEDRGPDPYR
jgi:ATP-dependent Zn protease